MWRPSYSKFDGRGANTQGGHSTQPWGQKLMLVQRLEAIASASAVRVTRHPRRLQVCLRHGNFRNFSMKRCIFLVVLTLVWASAWCDFTCPDGVKPVCLDSGDKVCPASARCVDNNAVCFDQFPCDANEGFVCESRYDAMMTDYKDAVKEHDALATQNVELREQRLEQKNCVLNAETLAAARQCVR